MQLAAATAANGTNRPIRGEMCCEEFREDIREEESNKINRRGLLWRPELPRADTADVGSSRRWTEC